ncbi:MAG: extracellular solute-binding protein [Pseudomonadota bacterium]
MHRPGLTRPQLMRTGFTRRSFGAFLGASAGAGLLPAGANPVSTLHGISAFGDLKYPAAFPHFDYVKPDAPKGGIWSTGHEGNFDSFNVFALKGNWALGIFDVVYGRLIYDSLMDQALDEADSWYGLVAETVEMPEDRSWIAFNMRPEARFHDGSPLTSADVLATIDLLRTKAKPFYRILLDPVSSLRAEGPHRVVYEFKEEEPKRDLPMLVASLPILSKAQFEEVDFERMGLTPFLTSGPYKIGRFDQGSYIEYERVPDYWAKDLPVNVGRDNFDIVRIDYFRERIAAFEGFKAGVFRFNEEYWSKVWATAYEPDVFPEVGSGEVIREVLPDQRVAGVQGFWFNHRRPVFQDAGVRKAIGMAFDFEWSNRALFYDLYERTVSFFQGGPMMADGKPTPGELAILEQFADQLPDGVLDDAAYVPPTTDGSGRARRTLRQAGQLLDQAGWSLVDGVRQKDGQPLAFEFLITSQGFARIVQPFIKNLERIGIQATLREVDNTQYEERMDRFEFDITTTRVQMSLTPGVELRGYYHSSSAADPGSRNYGGVSHPVIDALIERVERAENRDELTDTVKALDRVMRSMHLWIPQWSKSSHHVAYWDVFGRPEVKPTYDRGVVHYWWEDADKMAAMRAKGKL